ncbi:MAG TPA: LacI family DNA-binding transcriptional regulator [Acidobacteriaceae bacterium]|nr:LacI family DNA-binding transcriptional regulator [Acidobacteriaceae bacterium]
MSTIIEVAKRASVSTATVSNVIRGTQRVSAALQERVHKAIRELDYYPNELARSLKIKQTRMLGMVLPDITNPFFPEIMRGAEDTAFARGYLLLTANTDEQMERERRIVSALRSYRVDGILLASAPGKNNGHIQRMMEAGVSVVCIDRATSGIKADSVLVDNVRGARECVRHLIGAGYREIAVITGALELQTGRERLKGYEEALREAGIPVSKRLILEGDFRDESGYRLGKKLLAERERPSAVFVCNGVMALGLLRALAEMKVRCPEDIGIATFADVAIDRTLHPHLTAVVQPSYEIGVRAAGILMDRVEGKLTGDRVSVRIQPKLVIRESSRPLPGKAREVLRLKQRKSSR